MCFRFTSSPELFQSFMDLVLRWVRSITATVYTDHVVAFFMTSAYYLKHFSEFLTECASRGLPLSQESTNSLPTSGVVRVRYGLWQSFRSPRHLVFDHQCILKYAQLLHLYRALLGQRWHRGPREHYVCLT